MQLTRIELEALHPEWRRGELAMHVQPVGDGFGGVFRGATQRHVRMKKADIQLQAGGDQGVVESLS